MARGDALDFKIFCCVACKFENFGGEVFQNSSDINSSFGGVSMTRSKVLRRIKEPVPLAPTRILFWVLFFRKRLTRPQGN